MSPSVGVVIPTRGRRPDQLRSATRAALGQDHSGSVEVVIVVDDGDPVSVVDQVADLLAGRVPAARRQTAGARGVRVVANRLSPGLPGARNTGIAALGTDLVAFCDDDDQWLPGKLSAQVAALEAEPDAEFSSCAIEVEYGSRRVPRLAGTDLVTRAHLVRSRMVMAHSSTFLFRRGWPAGRPPDRRPGPDRRRPRRPPPPRRRRGPGRARRTRPRATDGADDLAWG